MKHRTQLAVATSLAGVAVAAVTGCGSANAPTAGAAATTRPVVITTTTTTTTTAPTATAVAPTAPPSAGPIVSSGAQCMVQNLRVSYTDNSQIREGALAGMSHADSVVTFTNTGPTTCTIAGYPGVALLDRSGHQVHQASRNPVAVATVTLATGQVASSLLAGDTASCDHPSEVAGLLVTAPDQTTSTRLGPAGWLCPASLTVGPVVRGDTGGVRV